MLILRRKKLRAWYQMPSKYLHRALNEICSGFQQITYKEDWLALSMNYVGMSYDDVC